MELEEAIKHAHEKAKELSDKAYEAEDMTDAERYDCNECAWEHEQIAHWLEELRQLRKDAEPNAWIYQIKTTGFGNYPVLVCGYCGKERRQVPLSFCANCGKRMHNAKELEEDAT